MAEAPTPEERADRSYASHTTMTNTYCRLLSKLIQEIRESTDSSIVREKTFMAHLIAISAIETFFNAYFQMLIEEEPALKQYKVAFYKEFDSPFFGISKKVRQWPKLILGKDYDPSDPAIIAFKKLVGTRNQLTHFKSTYSTLPLPGNTKIFGLADITTYENLSISDAEDARSAVNAMVEYVMTARGITGTNLPLAVARWTFTYPN